jgi:nucleoside-diphosphate-sugar epimerase
MPARASSMRLLVTGGGGFLGRHVLEGLRGHAGEVHAVSRRLRDSEEVRWHAADLLQPGEPPRVVDDIEPTHLLHLAWYTEHPVYWTSPENLRWTAASLDLLRAFASAGGRRAVFAGTCAEYDLELGDAPCRESATPERPSSLYGNCKLAVARVAEAFARAQGFEFAWGRIFYVFGPGEPRTRLIPSIAQALARGERATCLRGGDLKDYIYVRDAAAALVALIESSVSGPVNIATGSAVRLADLARLVGLRAGHPELVDIAAPADGAASGSVTANVDRLTREVGWRPEYPLVRGLDETIAWVNSPE